MIVATPEISPKKFSATLSLLSMLEAFPFIIATTFPLFIFFPSLVLVLKEIFLSKILKVSFAKLKPPTKHYS